MLSDRYVTKRWTGDEARSRMGPRGGLATMYQIVAWRWFDDRNDGCSKLGAGTIWSMQSQRPAAYSTCDGTGGERALPSVWKSSGADGQHGRPEGGLPTAGLWRHNI